MKIPSKIIPVFLLLAVFCHAQLQLAQSSNGLGDPGLEKVGSVEGQMIFATNSKENAKMGNPLPKSLLEIVKKESKLDYKFYRMLSKDTQTLFRGYENWLFKSEILMLSYEAKDISKQSVQLDLNFWQLGKKVIKTDPSLKKGEPLLIVGPNYRDGKILVAIELASLK